MNIILNSYKNLTEKFIRENSDVLNLAIRLISLKAFK